MIQIGDVRVDALSDGAPRRQLDNIFHDVDPALWTKAIGLSDKTELAPFNYGCFLIREAGRTTLIDTGYGAAKRDPNVAGSGGLLARLAAAGVTPDDVDEIIHTHLHSDHCGWDVNDDARGAITFPRAHILVAQAELDHWLGPPTDSHVNIAYIRSRIRPVLEAGLVRATSGDHGVSRAIATVRTPGHTPGHCSVIITSAGQKLLITGDVTHHPVHFEHPTWLPMVDVDRDASVRSRKKLADLAIAERMLITGGHYPILTLGRLQRAADRVEWVRSDGSSRSV
jgi:glyoxylase-like metal-dependent hydrolase (beta-lactamase superfamily II)